MAFANMLFRSRAAKLVIESKYLVVLAIEQGGSHEDAHRFLDYYGLADNWLHFQQRQANGHNESHRASRPGDAELDHLLARPLVILQAVSWPY